jgi:hypothetical protein
MTGTLSATRLEPEESAQLEITVTPNPGRPGFAGYVTLRTSSPRNPQLRIPVTGKITEPAGS